MGNISIIARRLSDRYVQYGWSGNGGYFKRVGNTLLARYVDPEMVEYLFGLGQLEFLWEPYSENWHCTIKTTPDGRPHWVGLSERQIFSKIAFIDHGYFYDADHTWYYVVPGPFRIKMPASLVEENLDENSFEFSFLNQVEHLLLNEIFSETYTEHLKSSGYDKEAIRAIREELSCDESPIHRLWHKYKTIFNCFDDWAVIHPDDSGKNVGKIVLRPREDTHVETIFW